VQGICQPVAIYKMQILLQIIYLTSFMMNHFSHNTSAVRTCGCKKKKHGLRHYYPETALI